MRARSTGAAGAGGGGRECESGKWREAGRGGERKGGWVPEKLLALELVQLRFDERDSVGDARNDDRIERVDAPAGHLDSLWLGCVGETPRGRFFETADQPIKNEPHCAPGQV